ncbi:MAG: glutathione S-transferase family protein [Burkholderiales bacterium]
MLKLFYAVGSCALASHIALEEAGAEYEAVRLDFAAGDQRKPEYLKVNPKGRVPALITDSGILTETPAILAYVAQVFPKAGLAPLTDPFAFARVQAFNSYLCSTAHVNHAHGGRGIRWADEPASLEDMKRKVPKNVGDSFALMESEMVEGPWVMGNAYTICDPYLFTVAGWLPRDRVDIARFPKIYDHHKRMAERPAVKKVLAAWS